MADRASAKALVARAVALYDASPTLADEALASARSGFGGGLAFMRARVPHTACSADGHALGFAKYGACLALGLAATTALGACLPLWHASMAALLVAAFVLSFYALEARLVFVFPAAAYGEPEPFRASWQLTRRAGGTLAAMRVVLPIASWMLFAPLARQGVVRAWATGCLAVLLWYGDLRGEP